MTSHKPSRVDLDDSRVIAIQREPGRLFIELEQTRANRATRITVAASGVSREDAEYYIGHNVTAPHPSPASPLDYIEFAEQGPDYLELGGYLKSESWYVWRIVATDFEIRKPDGQAT